MMSNIYYAFDQATKSTRRVSRPFEVDWFQTLAKNDKSLSRLIALLLLVLSQDTEESRLAIEGVFLNLASYLQMDGSWWYSCSDSDWEKINIACNEIAQLLLDPNLDSASNKPS